MQLQPAYSLRSDLYENLAAVLGLSLPTPAPDSFARIHPAPLIVPRSLSPDRPATIQVSFSHALVGHSMSVTGLAVSADGERVVSSSRDDIAKVWDVAQSKLLRTHSLDSKTSRDLDNDHHHHQQQQQQQKLGGGGLDTIKRPSRVTKFKRGMAYTGVSTPLLGLAGLTIAWAYNIYSIRYSNRKSCVALCPDGQRAVSGGCDRTVRVWHIESGQQLRAMPGHTRIVTAVAVSPDGCTAASASEDGTVKLWNLHTERCETTITHHRGPVLCVAFSPDGKMLASGSDDLTIRLWNVSTTRPERTIAKAHSDTVTGVAFTPDGELLASASADKAVKVWKWRSGDTKEEITFTGHTHDVNCIAAFPDGARVASGSDDGTIRIWNLRSRQLEHTLLGRRNWIVSLAISRDGRTLVSGSNDKEIRIWKCTPQTI